MAVTINGVICDELVDGYTEAYDIQCGPMARKGYICAWANRFAVAHGFLGLSSTTNIGGFITLNAPLAFPELAAESSNALASMYARSVEIVGVGPPVQGTRNISYPYAKVYVTFGPFNWSFSGIDYFQLDPTHPYFFSEQHVDFSAEYITIPGKSVFFKSSGKKLDQDWGFFSPIADMTITLQNYPYLPAATVLNALQAPINSTNYLQCNAGFLMFKGAQDDRTQTADGTQTAKVTYAFSYRPIAPWDYVYNGAAGIWDQVVDSTGTAIIARSNLSTIIPGTYVA